MDTQRNKEFFYEIKKHLTPSRFYHSLNVAYEAYRLAGIYKADREKAFTAGLLHDIMKDTPKQEQLKIITDNAYGEKQHKDVASVIGRRIHKKISRRKR